MWRDFRISSMCVAKKLRGSQLFICCAETAGLFACSGRPHPPARAFVNGKRIQTTSVPSDILSVIAATHTTCSIYLRADFTNPVCEDG